MARQRTQNTEAQRLARIDAKLGYGLPEIHGGKLELRTEQVRALGIQSEPFALIVHVDGVEFIYGGLRAERVAGTQTWLVDMSANELISTRPLGGGG
jgi:hypothetical protein